MDLEKASKKLVGNDEERAVSPVIGVILMVAITVILAAVIAAFVLDLGDTSSSAQAGLDISEDGDEVEITVQTIDRADEFIVRCVGECEGFFADGDDTSDGDVTPEDITSLDASVGDTVTINTSDSEEGVTGDSDEEVEISEDYVVADDDDSAAADSGTIQIIGVYEGEDTLLRQHDFEN